MDAIANLFPYQRIHLQQLSDSFDRHLCTIDSSDTGTGKTYTTSALCNIKNRSAFVICPKPVIGKWYKTLADFGARVLGVVNYESVKNGKYYASAEAFRDDKRVVCPYVRVVKDGRETDFEWDLPEDAVVVFDEAHKGKNHITINSQLLVSTKNVRDGVKLLILSATITDNIECFRVAAYLLGLSQYGKHAYRVWLRQIAQRHPGVTTEEAIHLVMYPEYGSRMRIRDLKASEDEFVRGLFKGNNVSAMCFDMSPTVEKEIADTHAHIEEVLEAIKNKQRVETCILTVLLRARQRLEMLRVPTLILLAMEHLLNGNSVVIFVNFTETITSLFQSLDKFVQDEFGSFITFIHKDQSAEERQYQVDSFQADRSRLMIASIRAGGQSIDMHDTHGNYPRVSIISPTWSSIDLKQSLGRIYRANARTNATQIIVYCKGKMSPAGPEGSVNDGTFGAEGKRVSVEELIAASVNKKLKTIEWLNNGEDQDDVLDLLDV